MAKKIIRVSPSLLAADFLNLKKEVNKVIKAKEQIAFFVNISVDVSTTFFVNFLQYYLFLLFK